MKRNRIAFLLSLIVLSIVMTIWRDMFLFSKSLPVPKWSYFLPYPFILTSDLIIFCLLPAAFVTERISSACLAVLACVLLAPLVPVINLMMSISYNPLINGMGNYLFIILFHCAFPAFFVVFIRTVINLIQKSRR